MTDQSPIGNSFRAAVLRGERPKLVLDEKHRRGEPGGDALDGGLVPRAESRRGNHRDHDRHRLTEATATVRHDGGACEVELVNLSSGGAMVKGSFNARLWDMVELELGEGSALEAAVRWVKGDKVGLEFAHETRLGCDAEDRAGILREVIRRSFPDLDVGDGEQDRPVPETPQGDLGMRGEARHPLIWKGLLHSADGTQTVRLRNISNGGALVDLEWPLQRGADLQLDIGKAGTIKASVSWAVGDQAGLRFHEPFDLAQLAKARPELVPPYWAQPAYLKTDRSTDSPWSENWNRMSLIDLEGYLKR